MVHFLKILPEYFAAVKDGRKTFEVRKNDRNFQVGDFVVLEEFENGVYTLKKIRVKITYILDDENFCKKGFVVFGFKKNLLQYYEYTRNF